MTVTNELMHEILISIRKEMREGFVDIKSRLNSLEGSMGLLLHEAGGKADQYASVTRQVDRLYERIEKLEGRLEKLEQQ